MSFRQMDGQGKWELTALNAIEQAVTSNALMAKMLRDGASPAELLALIHDTQIRLARDVKALRAFTVEREKEQP